MQIDARNPDSSSAQPASGVLPPELPRAMRIDPRAMTMQFLTVDMRYPAALAALAFAQITSAEEIKTISSLIERVHHYATSQTLMQHRCHGVKPITDHIALIAESIKSIGTVMLDASVTDQERLSLEALKIIDTNQRALKHSFESIQDTFFQLTGERIVIRAEPIDPSEMHRIEAAARRMPAS